MASLHVWEDLMVRVLIIFQEQLLEPENASLVLVLVGVYRVLNCCCESIY